MGAHGKGAAVRFEARDYIARHGARKFLWENPELSRVHSYLKATNGSAYAVKGKETDGSLPQGAVKELHTDEREHEKDRDHCQHQDDAEGDYALLSGFALGVPRHAEQCNRVRKIGPSR